MFATHIVILTTLFWNQPGRRELEMDTLRTPETPRAPRTPAVRRNLLSEFENTDSPVCDAPDVDFDVTTPIRPEAELSVHENEYSWGWKGLVTWWTLFVVLCASVISGFYYLLPTYIEIKFTREFQFVIVLTLSCVILLSVIWKICSNRVHVSDEQPRQHVTSTTRRRTRLNPVDSTYLSPRIPSESSIANVPLKRTFKGDGTVIWSEFIRYFENIANLNQWPEQRMRRILLTALRDQAEAYAYGLPETILQDYNSLKNALNQRFGHTALKDSYIAEAKLRRKRDNETFRDFGQAIEDLYRRAYPDNREYVSESSMKTFLDNCSVSDDFRLAVKRTRPKTLAEAVTAAMQEECIRFTENRKLNPKTYHTQVYDVKIAQGDKRNRGDKPTPTLNKALKKCFKCNSTQHLIRDCPKGDRTDRSNQSEWTGTRENQRVQQNVNQQLNRNRPRQ